MNPDQIKRLRKTMTMTQQQFAELLGVSFVTLNRWENTGKKFWRILLEVGIVVQCRRAEGL